MAAGGGVHHAANALELTQVQAENRRVSHAILLRGRGTAVDPRGSAAGLHGFSALDRGHNGPCDSNAGPRPRPLNVDPLSRMDEPLRQYSLVEVAKVLHPP